MEMEIQMERRLMGKNYMAMITCLMALVLVTAGCSAKRGGGLYDNESSADEMAALTSRLAWGGLEDLS